MKKKEKKVKKTQIGGQAVMEGVMMRGKTAMATAVRDQEGKIRLETKRITPPDKKPLFLRLPVVRGVVNFIDSMFGGTKTLMRSAEVYGEEEQPSRFEKWLAEKLHLDIMGVIGTIALILGVGLAIVLFIMLPQLITGGISALASIDNKSFLYNLIEGFIRIAIFVCYVLLTSLLKDIRRTYMYHGAEHKTITCYEKGLELTPENAKKCTRVHNRCGTTFLFFVMFISILVFSLANSFLGVEGIWRMLLKIALLPVVAGLSYELLKALSKTESVLVLPLKAPGLLLQRITTKEPDEDMLEVAITAFKTVLAMDEDPTIPEVSFITALKTGSLLEEVDKILKTGKEYERSDAEWIVSIVTGVKRSELDSNGEIQPPSAVERAVEMAKERAVGRPLWYIVGDAQFYGYTVKVDERVLIPRPETEELCAFAMESITQKDKVLDLCTGSGAIAVTVSKRTGASVVASDVSDKALEVARQNALLNGAEITFVRGDLFESLEGEKFSVIISNPPYIPTADIAKLDSVVKDHEPMLALDGGEDGLDFYRKIASQSPEYLTDGGRIFLECGIGQAEQVAELLKQSAFSDVQIRNDISGISRMVAGVYFYNERLSDGEGL